MNGQHGKTTRRLRVWDLPTRLFHWLLATLFVVAWASGEQESLFWLHRLAGYGVMTALLFRLAWGFVGGEHARWSDFVRGPGAVWAQLRAVATLRPPRSIGHNPVGGWMVLALTGVLGAAVVTGLLASDDGMAGPYAGRLGEVFAEAHEALATLAGLLVAAHVAGVLVESLLTGDNLVASMLRGWKAWPASRPADDARAVPWWHAAVALAAASAVVWWLLPR